MTAADRRAARRRAQRLINQVEHVSATVVPDNGDLVALDFYLGMFTVTDDHIVNVDDDDQEAMARLTAN